MEMSVLMKHLLAQTTRHNKRDAKLVIRRIDWAKIYEKLRQDHQQFIISQNFYLAKYSNKFNHHVKTK